MGIDDLNLPILILKFSITTMIDLKCYKFLLLMNIFTKNLDINTI